jgi:serine/threonine protein kinase
LNWDQGVEIDGSNPWISTIPGASHNLSARAPTTELVEGSSKVDEGKAADALLPYFTRVVCEAWCSSYPRSKPSRENIEAISRAGLDLCDPKIINLWFNKRLGMSADEDSGYLSSNLNLPTYPKSDVKRRSTSLIEMTADQSSRSTSSLWCCGLCNKKFTLKRVRDRHVKDAHSPPKHACNKCKKKYKRRYLLIEHLKTHDDDTNDVDEVQSGDDTETVASEADSNTQNPRDEDEEGGGASGSGSGHIPGAFSSSKGGHTSSNTCNFSSSSAPLPSTSTSLCLSHRNNTSWLPASWNKDCTPKFETLRFLGAGAWAAVREIKFHGANISVACKSPRSQSLLHERQILHEIRILNRLEHRNIVQSVGTLTTSNATHLLMLPVADYNLSTYLRSSPLRRGISESQVYGWWVDLTSALDYMHQYSCAHLDIKPDNILIKGNQILFSDFGVSVDFGTSRLDDNKGLRPQGRPTEMYAAPSVSRGAFSHPKSDLFSLGCVFLELLLFTQMGPLAGAAGASSSRAIEDVPSGSYSTHVNDILMWIPDLRMLSNRATRFILDWCVEALQEDENLHPKPAVVSEDDGISAEQTSREFSDLGFEAEQSASGTPDDSKRTKDITTRLHGEWSIERWYSVDYWLTGGDSIMEFLVTGKSSLPNRRQRLRTVIELLHKLFPKRLPVIKPGIVKSPIVKFPSLSLENMTRFFGHKLIEECPSLEHSLDSSSEASISSSDLSTLGNIDSYRISDTNEQSQEGAALLPADSPETGAIILRSEPLDVVRLPPSHMCLFDFLGCRAAFSDVSSWKSHILSHFLGRPLPPDATCPMCGSEFTEQPTQPGRAWETMLGHITQAHLKSGLSLRSANPDFALHRYLYRNGIISVEFYRRLCEGYARMGFDFGGNGLPFVLDPKSRRLRPLRGPEEILLAD